MRTYGSLGELPLGEARRVVAIGTFDGVHVGHQAIIGRAIERARERGLQSMVLTFEPNPLAILRPELAPKVLTEPAFKAQLIEAFRERGLSNFIEADYQPRERLSELLSAADIHLVIAGKGGDEISAYAEKLAADLDREGVKVILDDRTNVSPGVKFKDAELLGMPTIVVVGRGLADGVVEVKDRRTGERSDVPLGDVVQLLATR